MTAQLVSVVVPTYKRNSILIKRAITSVLNQTYKYLEIIIVDDSPDDFENRNEVKEYIYSLNDSRIKYIQHDQNYGANKARNTGIENSTGQFIAFLDDDDEWTTNKIELQYKRFTNEEIGLVYCRAIIINESNESTRPILNQIKCGYYYKELLKQNFIGSNSFVLIRRSAFKKIGLYDETLESNQDYDLFLRIAKEFIICGIDEVLVKYYVHNGERITTNSKKQLQGRLGLYTKYRNDIEKDKELELTWELKNIPLYFKAGHKRKAFYLFLLLFLKNPRFVCAYLNGTLNYIKHKKKTQKSKRG